jgi:hypothetical protein
MLNRTHAILLTTIVALLATAPVAAAKKTYQYHGTVTTTPMSTASGYPAPGGTAVLKGSVANNLGNGTLTDFVVITGQPRPNQFTFEGLEVDRYKDGAIGSTFTGTATVNDDGSQSIVVNGRFTPGGKSSRNLPLFGGTGRYRDAAGTYTFTGTIPAGSNEATGASTGTMTM